MLRWTTAVVILAFCVACLPVNSHAGQADEIALGAIFGTALGLIVGGLVPLFYSNPDADKNIETIMIISGLGGCATGVVFGHLLPDDAVEKDPVFKFSESQSGSRDWKFQLSLPTISTAVFQDVGGQTAGVATELFRIDF